jgi:microcystin-dependent protein
MKVKSSPSILSLALTASLLGSAAWSTDSYACAAEPYIGAVCIMATAPGYGNFGNGTYLPAQGQLLSVQNYAALFSILGATFGGDSRTNFNLPNLNGRVVMGSGTTPGTTQTYKAGQYGGAASASFTLAANQAPAHTHTLNALTPKGVTVTATTGNMAANTTLTGLAASVTGSAKLKASTGGNIGNDPTGKSLATTGTTTRIYSDAAPTITMNTSSIDSSGLTVGNFTGTPTTTLSGAPVVTISGSTDPNGGGAVAPVTVPTLPPFLAMNYYVAALGQYPARD